MIKVHIIAKNYWGTRIGEEDYEIRTWREKDALWQVLKKKYSQAYYIYMYSDGQRVDKLCVRFPSMIELRRQMYEKGRIQAKDLWKLKAGLI